ncbi:DUF2142 domain-containing protein [bacterium]|nr:MAG: DUF2142 domain-containing protein [bacterium]
MPGSWAGRLPIPRLATPILVGLMVLHAVMALVFAWEAPWRTPGISNGHFLPDISAPDEIAHANYVRELLQTGRLPILDPKTAGPELTYENHQSPLFYLLDAGAARVAGVDSVDTPRAALPLRAPNALIGAMTVAGVYFFVLWSLGSVPLGLAAAAIVALLPMNVAISGAVSNDPLLIALCTWALALAIRTADRDDLRLAVAVGALAGLAVLTKFTALLLIPVLPILLGRGRSIAVAAAVGAVLVVPYLLRNQQIYGHPLAAPAFNASFHRDVDLAALKTPYGFAHWAYVLLAGTALSFLGQFGYMDIHLPNLVAIPLIAALVIALAFGLRLPNVPKPIRIAMAVFVLLLIASYVSYNLWQVQPQARYLFPALAPIALMVVLGIRRLGSNASAALACLLAGLLVADVVAIAILPREYAIRAARVRG